MLRPWADALAGGLFSDPTHAGARRRYRPSRPRSGRARPVYPGVLSTLELPEAFASELFGAKVELRTGTQSSRIGKVEDIAVAGSERFPPVVGLYVKGTDGVVRYAPFSSIVSMTPREVTLGERPVEGSSAPVAIDELLIQKELLDKQIVDVDGHKVVRVNDVKLAPAG